MNQLNDIDISEITYIDDYSLIVEESEKTINKGFIQEDNSYSLIDDDDKFILNDLSKKTKFHSKMCKNMKIDVKFYSKSKY